MIILQRMTKISAIIIVLVIAIIIGLLMLFQRRDVFFNLVLIWAFTGIIIKHMDEIFPVQDIINVAAVGSGLIAVGIIFQLFRKKIY